MSNLQIKNFPSQLQNDMAMSWPTLSLPTNDRFWSHEWTSHGMCQPSKPYWYFSTGITLYHRIDLYNVFHKNGIASGTSNATNDVRNIISTQAGGKKIILRCSDMKNGTYFLSEVVICIDMVGQNFIDCNQPREIAYNNCVGGQLTYA